MEEFIIEGGVPLRGEVTPAGNKNAALPMLAACLLSDQPIVLHNVPQIRDVLDMRSLIESMGTHVEELDERTWRLTTPTLRPADLDLELCRRIRASILLAGPVTARGAGCACLRPAETSSGGAGWTHIRLPWRPWALK